MTTAKGTAALTPEAEIPSSAWLAMWLSTLVFFLVVIDVSAVNVAFPSIADDFNVSETNLSWIISAYNITIAALLLVAGRLADSHGRKLLFIPGVAVFAVGSALSGLAPTTMWLVAARIIQATGGAVVGATSMAVVLPAFPISKRSTVIGIMGAVGSLGAVAGPALGSVLIDVWSWRGIFLINLPLSFVVLLLAPRVLTETKNPNATGKIDLLGVPIGTAGIGLVMLAIVRTESTGIGHWTTILMMLLGLGLMAALVRRSAHHPEPLIELDLFSHRSFSSTNLGLAFYSLAFTSGFLANSLLLQRLWGQSISTTGKALIAGPFVAAVISPISGRLADRVGHRWILSIGSLCSAAGFLALLLLVDKDPHVFDHFVPITVLIGIGVGATLATWSSAGISDIAPAQFGTANATIRTTQQVFYALGISITIALVGVGGGPGDLQGYRWAWGFIAGTYVASALAVAITFPSGSSRDRAGVSGLTRTP